MIDAFVPYTDSHGMVGLDGPYTTDNGNLYTSFYVLGLKRKDLLDDVEAARLRQVYANNFVKPGLYTRYPGCVDYEAHDDLLGILMADALLNPESREMSKAIYKYGSEAACVGLDNTDASVAESNQTVYAVLSFLFRKIKWNFNPVKPEAFSVHSWLGRRIETVATLGMAAGEPIGLVKWLYWATDMIKLSIAKDKNDNVGYALMYCSAIACEHKGGITGLICRMLKNSIKKMYGDAGQLFGAGHLNVPNHPLITFLQGVL